MSEPTEHRKVVIIGSGPAGYTAALYASRALLEPLLFMGQQPGGQLTITTDVENYPGFPEGIQGPDLVELFRKQCERFGTELLGGTVTSVDLSRHPFVVVGEERTLTCDALIVATGAEARYLDLPSIDRLKNKGVLGLRDVRWLLLPRPEARRGRWRRLGRGGGDVPHAVRHRGPPHPPA